VAVGQYGTLGSISSSGAWTPLTPGPRHDLHMVSVASDGTAWAASSSRVVRSTPMGWTNAAPMPMEPGPVSIRAIQPVAPDEVWGAAKGESDPSAILGLYSFVTRYGATGAGPVMRLPMSLVNGLWVCNANDAWAAGYDYRHGDIVAHFDGHAWNTIEWA